MPTPLLVVVDMQDVFRDTDSPWATSSFDDAARGVDRLLEGFGDRVVFTRFVPPSEMPGSWGAYYPEVRRRPTGRPAGLVGARSALPRPRRAERCADRRPFDVRGMGPTPA